MKYAYDEQNQQLRYNNDPTLPFRYEIELLKGKLALSQEKNVMYESRIVQYENQIEQNKNQLEFLKQIIKSTEAFEYTIGEDEYDEDEDDEEEEEEDEEMDDYEKDEDYIYDGPIEDDISESGSEFSSDDSVEGFIEEHSVFE